jgi:hypothetical protein
MQKQYKKDWRITKMKIAGVEFDDHSQKIIVTGDANSNFTHIFSNAEYMYWELESYEYIENNGVVAKGGGVGRALIGGFLFGSTGAIVGAVTRKPKQKNVVENMDVRMTFRINGEIKTERVELNKSGNLKYGTMAYEKCLTNAKQLIDKLDQISQLNQEGKTLYVSPEPIVSQPVQVIDVKAKLLELKDLYEEGLIDEEEYKSAKKDVLAGNSNSLGANAQPAIPALPNAGNETIGNNVEPKEEVNKPRLSDSELVELANYIKENFDEGTKFKAINYYRKQAGVKVAEATDIVEKILDEKKNIADPQESSDIVQDATNTPDVSETEMDVNTDSVEKQPDTSINLSKESVTEEILLCPSCKKQLNKGTKFCVFCGTKIEEKIPCPNCGKLISKSSKFCNYCGEGMKEG